MPLFRLSRRPAASVLAVALALAGTPGALPTAAQDSPEAAVDALFDTIEAGRFDAVGDVVCAEYRDAVASQFDLTAAFADIPGVDPQAFLAAITFSVVDREVSVTGQDEDSAVVTISARLTGSVDEEAARAFVRSVFEAAGQEVSDADVEAFLPSLVDPLEEGTTISSEGTDVVLEDGRWLVCDDLSDEVGPSGSPGPAETLPPAEGNLCGLASVEELNALGRLQFSTADPSVTGWCTWLADESVPFASLTVLIDSGITDFETLQQVFADAEEMTVAGRPALFTGGELYVITDAGTLLVSAYVPDEAVLEVDLAAYLASVAEVFAPRLEDMTPAP